MNIQEKMSVVGIGLKLFSVSGIYALLLIYIDYIFDVGFVLPLPSVLVNIIGIMLLSFGICFLVFSLRAVIPAHASDKLCTDGVYSLCRNPVYGAWIIFIIPGICLFLPSVIYLTVPVFAYFVFRFLIKHEEIYLEKRFGERYIDYRRKTPLLFPQPLKYKKKSRA